MITTLEEAQKARRQAVAQIAQILADLEKETGIKPIPSIEELYFESGSVAYKVVIDLKL